MFAGTNVRLKGVPRNPVMARKLLHLLLITAIFLCPITCGPGLCSSAGQCSLPHDCACECGHPCDEEGPNEHPDQCPLSPCDHDPCQDCCQCICGGAILPDSVELDVVLLLTPSFDSMATSGGIHDLLATHRPRPDQTAPDDDGAPSGRAIRCLHSSFLC